MSKTGEPVCQAAGHEKGQRLVGHDPPAVGVDVELAGANLIACRWFPQ
jgi:hypothetical protein